MNRKTIGEAIYIRVSNRKYNLIATQRGNVPTKSWRGKSAVFRMHSSLTSHGSSKTKAVGRQRNLGLQSAKLTRTVSIIQNDLCKSISLICKYMSKVMLFFFFTSKQLLKNVPSELNKYGTDKELQRSDNSIFCVAHLGFFRT